MSNSERLSEMQKKIGGGRAMTGSSKYMDKNISEIVNECIEDLKKLDDFNRIQFVHDKKIEISNIVNDLKHDFPEEDWYYKFDGSSLRPDGGILYITSKNNNKKYPILIAEMKKQGTNYKVVEQTGKKQARGNAIERLGKNVIGFRTWFKKEKIFPFVCFGWGCDFVENSSILDRVVTIAEFGELNKIYHMDTEKTKRGTFYFRSEPYTAKEMKKIIIDICQRSIYYYYSKYGKKEFLCD